MKKTVTDVIAKLREISAEWAATGESEHSCEGRASERVQMQMTWLTKTQEKRGKQIDKVYSFFEEASSAYADGHFIRATNMLVKLRDWLNAQDLPKKKGKENR